MFVSLATQLMKLVGLKTAEMAEERRFSTIITSFDCSQSQVIGQKMLQIDLPIKTSYCVYTIYSHHNFLKYTVVGHCFG